MNIALDGESPYDNSNLFGYMMKHMSVMASGTDMKHERYVTKNIRNSVLNNSYFYTTDGMRFEFNKNGDAVNNTIHKLHENSSVNVCMSSLVLDNFAVTSCGGCGSYGLNSNSNNTTKPPCLVMVDVNGDRKPSPTNVSCRGNVACSSTNYYYSPTPNSKKLTDIFTIIITEDKAIPYGVVAQKAMYQAQK